MGTTGNAPADTPHLHFQVMSSPDALASNGLPYTFDNFRLTGQVTNIDAAREGAEMMIAPLPASARPIRRGVLPLEANVLNFSR